MTYLRDLNAVVTVTTTIDETEYTTVYETVPGTPAETKAAIRKCTSSGGDNCRSIKFNKNGEAHIKGYIYVPTVLDKDAVVKVKLGIEHSTYMTALWPVNVEAEIETSEGTATVTKKDYCQVNPANGDPNLVEYPLMGGSAVRARYDENTGEARFQASVANIRGSFKNENYVIPAEVRDYLGNRYTDSTCKYTVYNTVNAAPRTDYCKFGEGIRIAPNGVVRFDITIDHLASNVLLDAEGDPIPFTFRVGGMTYLMSGAFEAVDYPCPPVSRMSVMNPLKPFMTFYGMESDGAIKASGAYGVYEGGVWGMYQKCGKYAFMAVRLKNDGTKDEVVNLSNVAVAVNGGTVADWKWVLTTIDEDPKGKVTLEPGDNVILFLRAKVTDIPSQLNSDAAMTGAVNFTDYGFYITGKVFSDHNNTNCVAP